MLVICRASIRTSLVWRDQALDVGSECCRTRDGEVVVSYYKNSVMGCMDAHDRASHADNNSAIS
jgi:hypothetical protein